jgi:hypothetical protein
MTESVASRFDAAVGIDAVLPVVALDPLEAGVLVFGFVERGIVLVEPVQIAEVAPEPSWN